MQVFVDSLIQILGPNGWQPFEQMQGGWRDWLDRNGVPPIGIARPKTTEEVSAIVRTCLARGVFIVPQGGNTGLCGASVAASTGGIIVSLSRMNAVDDVHSASTSVTVEAGVTLQNLHSVLEGNGHMFPLHLGSEGSAQIGGLIGTNAGGSHAFRFGMMQDLVLGLEVVLADGTVWDGMRAVQKDNAGYQLRKLLCGSEGTLGIVTRAILKLYPVPVQRTTALLAMNSMDALATFGMRLQAEVGELLTGLEFISDEGVGLMLKHLQHASFPLGSRSPFYLLVEAASGSSRIPLTEILEGLFAWGMEEGLVVDGSVAASGSQRQNFWQIREEQPEGQRLEGPQLKHDIAVAPGAIAQFLAEGERICQGLLPGLRINAFGHFGDGNIHYNLSPPEGSTDFGGQGEAIGYALAKLAHKSGGSFAAEHGLGRSKVALADRYRGAPERGLMRSIKSALDPKGLFNPGVIVG